jgi:KDO2-lipid IV(A) lauroyltransferase
MALVRWLPLPAALALGRGMGTLMRLLARKRYRVALKNLDIAFGESKSRAEKERIARDCFKHFGMFAVESLKFGYLSQAEVDRRIYVDPESQRDFDELMSHGKGCLLITGHIGNFEIAGRWITARGHELFALARRARDTGTTDVMTQARERMGIKVVTLNQSLKPVFAGLKRNALVAIICDQNAGDVFVPFFGRPTGTVDGPARIALRMGTPMLFFYCVRDGKGGYAIRSHGHYWAEPTGETEADVVRAMTEVNRKLEEIIRLYPEQWLWFHDRWKSSPKSEAEVAPQPA